MIILFNLMLKTLKIKIFDIYYLFKNSIIINLII